MDKIISLMSESLRSHLQEKLKGRTSERFIDKCIDEWFGRSVSASADKKSYTVDELQGFGHSKLRMICNEFSIVAGKTKGNCISAILEFQAKPEFKKCVTTRSHDDDDADDKSIKDKKKITTPATPKRIHHSISESDDVNHDADDEHAFLQKKTIVELKVLCKQNAKTCGGNKQELIDRLMGKSVSIPKTPRQPAKTPARPPHSPKTPKTIKGKERALKPVINTLLEAKKQHDPYIPIEKVINNKTYLIDEKSGYVFDNQIDQVVSILVDGHIRKLTPSDIEDIKKAGLAVKYTSMCDEDSSDDSD
jgi:hypothetical protein